MTFESFRSRESERKRDGGQVAAPVETTSAVVVEFMVVTCWEVKGQFLSKAKQPCRVRSGTKTLEEVSNIFYVFSLEKPHEGKERKSNKRSHPKGRNPQDELRSRMKRMRKKEKTRQPKKYKI